MPADTPETPGTTETIGLRERKKQAMRNAILDAAYRLFAERGYLATTIDDIAEQVDVSPRTIFRYFASKEALLFAGAEEMIDALNRALAERPEAEPLVESLRTGVKTACGVAADQAEHRAEGLAMIKAEPSLREYQHQVVGQRIEQAIVDFVAARLGADPASDVRPRVLGAAVKGALLASVECTFGLDPGAEPPPPVAVDRALLMQAVDDAFDALTRGFS
ncbi:MAG TPA: TetR family transcriptional regulator [Acidimicrobiales bacterium]|nr:TetR family transcriptional regulator [Acidimicrobiales bacterium]